LAAATTTFLLLLPDVEAAGTVRLHAIWSGDLQSGLTQALNGGYCAFRLLVSVSEVVPGSQAQNTKSPVDFSLRKGQFVILRRADSAKDANWTGGQARLFVVGVEDSLASAKQRAAGFANETLISELVAIGFADGGEAAGVTWNGWQATFSS
jgi:hypothetical protein